jgi:hypothetical protein
MIIRVRSAALAVLFALNAAALAQTSPPSAQPAAAPSQQLLNNQQLDALVAPIALYPDTLLSEVLMASTYPLEVVEAARWADANKNLKGDALKQAIDKQSWDDSVKSLAATPSVLGMMSDKLDWTQKLGDAVLAQQPDVMDAIQRLRQKAQANNKLPSNKQQTVSTQQQGSKQVITIAPTDPDTIYVPYYDPAVVYGQWPYADYPPYYWPAPGYIAAGVIATGIAFGAGYAVGRWVSGGYRWGGGLNWGGNNILVNRSVNINNVNVNNWTHNTAHRQGVRYANADVAAKFGNRTNVAGGAQNRLDFRGRSGQEVLRPGGPGGGNARPDNLTPGNRLGAGGAGTRDTGNRPGAGGAGTRQTGDRAGAGANRAGQNVSRPGGGGAGTRQVGGGGGRGPGAYGNISSGRVASLEAGRGRASFGGGGGGGAHFAGGGGGGGGGGFRGGGGGGGGGGGRRSDARLKHDIVLLDRLDNGIGFYRFVYNGDETVYVGVLAQDVQSVMPEAVRRARDGYLRVSYDKLGLKFETYDEWIASGARLPVTGGR